MTLVETVARSAFNRDDELVRRPSRSFPRRLLRRGLWRWLLGNVKGLTALALGFIPLVAVTMWILPTAYARGLVQGVLVAALVGSVLLMYLMTSEGTYHLGGAWGEDNTRSELKTARKRGLIWGAVDSIEVGGIDIDHLVIAPGGALAIDSKWHFGELRRTSLERDTWRAKEGARKAASVLRSAHIRTPMEVSPLVVVWGRGQREIPAEGIEFNGVQIVAGADLRKWLERVRHGKIAQDNAESVLAAVESFAKERRGKQPLPEARPVGSGIRP